MALLLAMIVADGDSDDGDDSGVSLYFTEVATVAHIIQRTGSIPMTDPYDSSYRSYYAQAIKNHSILTKFTSIDCKKYNT